MSSATLHPARHPVAAGERFKTMARAHPLRAYIAVTFAFTWTWELVLFGIFDAEFIPAVIPGTFGPALAAYVVTRTTEGRDGLRALKQRLTLWRVPLRWYAVAMLGLPLLALAGYVFMPDGTDKLNEHSALVIRRSM